MTFLGLGGNQGNVPLTLISVLRDLETHDRVEQLQNSSIYQSEPWGMKNQADFFNMVVSFEWLGEFDALTRFIVSLEKRYGRDRLPLPMRWGPRMIDIDILTYGNEKINGKWIVPHPRMHERLFVLEPFAEIAPDFIPAGWKMTIDDARNSCSDQGEITKLDITIKTIFHGKN